MQIKKNSKIRASSKSRSNNSEIIFNIYKQIPFNLNSLINAKNIYQTLDDSDARSLIFQKYLLSEDMNSKLEYLFLLDDLFKKIKSKIYILSFSAKNLEEIGLENIPKKLSRNRKTKHSS